MNSTQKRQSGWVVFAFLSCTCSKSENKKKINISQYFLVVKKSNPLRNSQHQLMLQFSICITLSNLGLKAVESFVSEICSYNDNKKCPTIDIRKFCSTYVKNELHCCYPELSLQALGDNSSGSSGSPLTDDKNLYEHFITIRELNKLNTSSLKHTTGNAETLVI